MRNTTTVFSLLVDWRPAVEGEEEVEDIVSSLVVCTMTDCAHLQIVVESGKRLQEEISSFVDEFIPLFSITEELQSQREGDRKSEFSQSRAPHH